MKLNELRDNPGARVAHARRSRHILGKGKTAGRGVKVRPRARRFH